MYKSVSSNGQDTEIELFFIYYETFCFRSVIFNCFNPEEPPRTGIANTIFCNTILQGAIIKNNGFGACDDT